MDNIKTVLEYFESICKIPHASGDEKALSDYLLKFAEERGLYAVQDSENNILIKKPGTKVGEPVIIQGHIDMVAEKNMDTEHDFAKDGIKTYIEDDYIMARGTTLGADDGIAVAFAMALLDSKNIKHPPLEIIMTTNEETGMNGAKAFDTSLLDGRMMINIDSEEEGRILSSCAGGMKVTTRIPIEYKNSSYSNAYSVTIKGFKGGHSGSEIDKGRGNAIKQMGRLLYDINKKYDISIAHITCPGKDNAIPRECSCMLLSNEDVSDEILKMEKALKHEFKTTDGDVHIVFEKTELPNKQFSKQALKNVISYITLVPNGIQTMSFDIEGLPESSTNIGVAETDENEVKFDCALRSSVATRKDYIFEQMQQLGELIGAVVVKNSEYPAWEYNPDSRLRKVFCDVYEQMFDGKKVEVVAIHAGLECGLLAEKIPSLDIVSFGPNIYGAHSPKEKMSLSSASRMWDYLLKVLETL